MTTRIIVAPAADGRLSVLADHQVEPTLLTPGESVHVRAWMDAEIVFEAPEALFGDRRAAASAAAAVPEPPSDGAEAPASAELPDATA